MTSTSGKPAMICYGTRLSRIRPFPTASPLWRLFATSKQEQSPEGTTSKRKQFKQTPIDPRLYQHLERLGLGWVSRQRTRFPKKMPIPDRVDPQTVPYFQRNRFRQGKRALRQEKKRLEREAINRARAGLLRPAPASSSEEGDADERKKGPFAVRAKTRLARVTRIEDLPLPIPRVPELAIIGRSNVGKSTLLNSVLGIRSSRKKAAVEDRPGVTQSLDFYVLGPQDRPLMVVVDMPGYGFAFANEEKQEAWQKLMLHYLRHPRPALKRILMLVDARHGFKLKDREFLEKLYSTSDEEDDDEQEERGRGWGTVGQPVHVPKLQVVLTKCDMVTREDLARRYQVVMQQLQDVLPRETRMPVLMVSANKGQGVQELRKDLGALVPPSLLHDLDQRTAALKQTAAVSARPPVAQPASPAVPPRRGAYPPHALGRAPSQHKASWFHSPNGRSRPGGGGSASGRHDRSPHRQDRPSGRRDRSPDRQDRRLGTQDRSPGRQEGPGGRQDRSPGRQDRPGGRQGRSASPFRPRAGRPGRSA